MAKRKRRLGEPPETTRRELARAARQTVPRWSSAFGMLPYSQIPRRAYESYDVSQIENARLSTSHLLSLLPDLNPDIGLALWNVLRLGSQGLHYECQDSAGQDDPAATAVIEELLAEVNAPSGGINNLIVQWLMSGYLQGAVAGECVLTPGLLGIDEFVAVDPFTIVFRRGADGKLRPYQKPAGGGEIELNTELFWYIPIDPAIDDPYGRPPAAPVLQEVWFDIALISDLRKVMRNQGFPRIDIKILEESVRNAAPAYIQQDAEQLQDWLNTRLSDVVAAYNELAPDDSFVHFDSVEVASHSGTAAGRMFDASAVIQTINHRMIVALKQLPILMGSNEGTTETHGTIQWQIYAAGLLSLQQPIAYLIEQMCQVALDVAGIQSDVRVWFEPIRTADRMADAQAEAVEIRNALTRYGAGLQSWEETAIELTGSPPPPDSVPPDPALLGIGMGASGSHMDMGAGADIPRSGRERRLIERVDDGTD